jgi:hypothetical protein
MHTLLLLEVISIFQVAFVLGYTLETKVRPLHQGYVSATALYLALSSE